MLEQFTLVRGGARLVHQVLGFESASQEELGSIFWLDIASYDRD